MLNQPEVQRPFSPEYNDVESKAQEFVMYETPVEERLHKFIEKGECDV